MFERHTFQTAKSELTITFVEHGAVRGGGVDRWPDVDSQATRPQQNRGQWPGHHSGHCHSEGSALEFGQTHEG